MPDITDLFAQRATLRRSTSLLTAFRFEQSAPERFYGTLAQDTVHLITDLWQQAEGVALRGRTVLDVGGGPGYFASAFADAG
ncbi:SAM-dependent methyltransferase, partial [Mycobacteroides abscessus subsp. abscessus]|nr:SAM-dependent methyltransferase [Mycobacteroides abscessus subsp. abscessus]